MNTYEVHLGPPVIDRITVRARSLTGALEQALQRPAFVDTARTIELKVGELVTFTILRRA